MLMVHGRGATAMSMFELADVLAQPDMAYLAPEAAGRTWYPQSFLAPIENNEPGLSSGLQAIADGLDHLAAAGFPSEYVALLGFSQGACLALEFAARNARRYGAVIALSGGLIGPEGTSRTYAGSLEGTPVFLGCSDTDMHIPLARVRESAEALKRLDASVDTRIYPGMGHTINDDEVKAVRGLLATLQTRGETT
ncbi:MAG: dienelactone hydrolase family protein [Pseudomonadota bacterium]